jgi:Flp pilus assembly CpaE family ATPase
VPDPVLPVSAQAPRTIALMFDMRQARTAVGPQLGLAFARENGPVVAVVGLGGGAGASTVAHLLAAAAARESSAAVLLAETCSASGALAAYAGTSSRRSLADLAREVEHDTVTAGAPFAVAAGGLRVVAGGPTLAVADASESAVHEVLRHARAAHGLVVVDCAGVVREIDGAVLDVATHVLWVVQASAGALRRARRVLDLVEGRPGAREVLLARREPSTTPASLASLSDLASRRRAAVVLVPQIADVEDLDFDARVEQASVALHDLAGVLQR